MFTYKLTRYSEIPDFLAKEIFLVRKKIFHDRLGWSIPCCGDQEKDPHDLPNTQILVATFATHHLAGYARLLPTDDICMLDTTLPFPNIDRAAWKGFYEISRFFLVRNRAVVAARLTARNFFRELILAAHILCANGYLAAVDSRMLSCLSRCGWDYRVVSTRFGSAGDVIFLVSLAVDNKALDKVSSGDPHSKGK